MGYVCDSTGNKGQRVNDPRQLLARAQVECGDEPDENQRHGFRGDNPSVGRPTRDGDRAARFDLAVLNLV